MTTLALWEIPIWTIIYIIYSKQKDTLAALLQCANLRKLRGTCPPLLLLASSRQETVRAYRFLGYACILLANSQPEISCWELADIAEHGEARPVSRRKDNKKKKKLRPIMQHSLGPKKILPHIFFHVLIQK
jgi:hypothetical protein